MYKVVHVANNLLASNVHKEIIDRYDKESGSKSLVIVPVKRCDIDKKNELLLWRKDILFLEVPTLLRFFPIIKLSFSFAKLLWLHRAEIRHTEIWFGHSLWTDGGLCWLSSHYINIKYYLFLRNTDVNVFAKIPWVRIILTRVMLLSEKIFIPTQTYLEKAKQTFKNVEKTKAFLVLPNGIEDFWHDNVCVDEMPKQDLVYVGKGDKNKNFENTFRAIQLGREALDFSTFHVVGVTVADFERITGLHAVPAWVQIHGILDKGQLLEIYRRSKVLVLPSYVETFGLVYIEALSQGCFVICSRGQGVSLDFEDCSAVGVVDPDDIEEISLILKEFLVSTHKFETVSVISRFRWKTIVKDLYLHTFSENKSKSF